MTVPGHEMKRHGRLKNRAAQRTSIPWIRPRPTPIVTSRSTLKDPMVISALIAGCVALPGGLATLLNAVNAESKSVQISESCDDVADGYRDKAREDPADIDALLRIARNDPEVVICKIDS